MMVNTFFQDFCDQDSLHFSLTIPRKHPVLFTRPRLCSLALTSPARAAPPRETRPAPGLQQNRESFFLFRNNPAHSGTVHSPKSAGKCMSGAYPPDIRPNGTPAPPGGTTVTYIHISSMLFSRNLSQKLPDVCCLQDHGLKIFIPVIVECQKNRIGDLPVQIMYLTSADSFCCFLHGW